MKGISMRIYIATFAAVIGLAASAEALTLKTGEVLGPDGEVYHGASPKEMEALISRAQSGDMPAGVVGNNVYVVGGEEVTFIPVKELMNTTRDTKLKIIGDQVVQDITGSEEITFEQIQTLQEVSEATGEDVAQLVSEEGIEGLDEDLLAELETVAGETGIKFENLVAVNAVLETLPDNKVEELMDDIGDMIDDGFADQIDATLTELAQIEGGLENALNFDSLEECVAAGASNCEATAAIMEANDFDDDDDDDE
jgi:hypothetical protein